MIPEFLRLENFMTYTEAELDFKSFRIACLAGNNGAGKSTILDALTWALFDSSRASDSEDLIRIGTPETRVELRFQLEGQLYRIIRSRRRKGKGKASGKAALEFQIESPEGYRSLSGKKISETQARIEQTLRMNYSLFVNSSFILQGRADAFTTASPAERKRVLADILQLEAYEKIRLEAVEQKRELKAAEAALKVQMLRFENELSAQEHLEAHLSDSRGVHAGLLADLSSLEAELEAQRSVAEQQRQLSYEAESLTQRRDERVNQISALNQRLDQLKTSQEAVARWLERADSIEQGHAELLTSETALRECESDFARFRELEQQIQHLQSERERLVHQQALERQQARHLLEQLELEQTRLDATLQDQTRIETGYTRLQAALKSEKHLLEQQSHWQQLDSRRRELEQTLTQQRQRLELQLQSLSDRITELNQALSARPALSAEQTSLNQQLDVLTQQATRRDEVQTRGLELRHEQENLQREAERLTLAQDVLRQRREQLQAHHEAHLDSVCPTCERLLTLADLELLLNKYAADSDQLEHERLALIPQIQQLETEILAMRRQYQQLTRELKPREELQTRLGSVNSSLQGLQADAARLQTLTQERETLARSGSETARSGEAALAQLEHELASLKYSPAELGLVQTDIRDWQWAEARHKELTQALSAVASLKTRLANARDQLQRLESLEASQTPFRVIDQELAERQELFLPLQAVPARRQTLLERVETLRPYAERHIKLQEARVRAEGLSSQLQELTQDLSTQSESLKCLEQELQLRREALTGAEELLAREQTLIARVRYLHEQEKALHAEIFSLEKELENLQARSQALAEQQAEGVKLQYEIQLYEVLEESFGKNGLQAVLIENALPEIEHIANEMLASMTEGRMHVKLQTLRSLKSKDKLAETLDILISDELGTRNYETFSAGEAFRVNFALRLAISKLLARRAGARLQTLVIDEGFGSQDSEGKTRLIEAINTVAPDFAKILVITHVDELKALFPCRIEVTKHSGGSEARVLHV